MIVGAYFAEQETLNGYYHVFNQILEDYGSNIIKGKASVSRNFDPVPDENPIVISIPAIDHPWRMNSINKFIRESPRQYTFDEVCYTAEDVLQSEFNKNKSVLQYKPKYYQGILFHQGFLTTFYKNYFKPIIRLFFDIFKYDCHLFSVLFPSFLKLYNKWDPYNYLI